MLVMSTAKCVLPAAIGVYGCSRHVSVRFAESETSCRYEDEGYGGQGQWRFVGPQGETMEAYEPEPVSDPESENAISVPADSPCSLPAVAPAVK